MAADGLVLVAAGFIANRHQFTDLLHRTRGAAGLFGRGGDCVGLGGFVGQVFAVGAIRLDGVVGRFAADIF